MQVIVNDPRLSYSLPLISKTEMWTATNRDRETEALILTSACKEIEIKLAERWSTTKIWKNLMLISAGFLFLFTAYSSLANIQSSLNSDEGLGLASLCSTYVALVLSCMFVPPLFIQICGCKWTMVISMLLYTTYMAANFYANWFTLLPSAFLVGVGAAPLWSAKCTYLTKLGTLYAQSVGETAEGVIVRFFGIFFMIFQCGQFIGNLISSLILQMSDDFVIGVDQLEICGAEYCNQDFPYFKPSMAVNHSEAVQVAHVSHKPPMSKVYMLCVIYLAFAFLAAIIIAVFVDNLDDYEEESSCDPVKSKQVLHLLVSTFRLMKDPNLLFIIPLTIYMGIAAGFITGDYTKSFVTCSLGIQNVGFVMVCYGVVDAAASLCCSPIVVRYGRLPLYLLAAASTLAMLILMLSWHPDPHQPFIYFFIAGWWGLADGIWLTQVSALFSVLFPDSSEAAFSNFRLWESLGYIFAFAYSNSLCISTKLYILFICLVIGMLGYFVVEFIQHKNTKLITKRIT